MTRFWSRLRSCRAELDEASFVLPVLLLVSIALVNLAMLGFAAMNANNAANYGARMGSVAATNAPGLALAAAKTKAETAKVGSYAYSVSGSDTPGSLMTISVAYTVPNYFGGLISMFGVSMPNTFQGVAQAWFRKEGW
ncbi:MAG: hypothetical protein CO094_08365 [Anaerolineae bacterium CG_4_9_14_3_um_filter_57_17]|nr:hypothetical protein [bacterium]NCT19740.1 hypothetical protein [bacterium]OIO85198.1 MAG: hypothetical protein AUK01_06870 [Anaerolineae bacterium CG2_30_57_67]PJB65987.1 MAG: hypothetical protein CO094_08365 [Anaerolineae bacterium CG_4_9_14_3_um_filter_57_17]